MAAAGSFSVYAKTLTGSTAEVRTSPDETIAALKEKIESALKLTVPILRLVYDSKELTDTQTVGEHGIAKESIIIVVIGSSKPCHFFFALDESGSMSGGRWQQLLNSFQDFVIARHKDAEKKGTKIVDRVSVFFHETGCRVASWRKPSGEVVPFDDIPLADVTPESLVNDFRSGGNDFFTVLSFLTPYLRKSAADYIPVLMFMTDGGDCGVRERGYQKIKELKEELKDMVLYVTVVYTTSQYDIDGGKQLCLAAGFDVETFFTYIPGNESQGHYGSPMGLSAYPGYPSPAPGCPLGASPGYGSPTSYGPPPSYGCPPPSYGPPLPSSPVFSLPSSPYPSMALSSAPPSLASSPESISPYTSAPPSSMPSPSSAQQLMAKQWEHAYQCTSSYVPR